MREETVLERLNEIALSMDKKETCYLEMQASMKELKEQICCEAENGEGVLLPIAGERDNKRYLNK